MGNCLKRSMLWALCGIGAVGMLLPIAFSQEEAVNEVVSGEIISVDSEKSELVVRYLADEINEKFAEMTVKVNTLTAIESDYGVIGLAGLKVGNKVSIEYTTGESGENTAIYIWVEAKEGTSSQETPSNQTSEEKEE